ncbi:hypothetical protein REIS_0028 [Rickettsia endosymbiont of Ixodes scapularis]|nr:hypothetical protein REIS_0028 [Rickettsia endosymbiont of Ixodes scapularis]
MDHNVIPAWILSRHCEQALLRGNPEKLAKSADFSTFY